MLEQWNVTDTSIEERQSFLNIIHNIADITLFVDFNKYLKEEVKGEGNLPEFVMQIQVNYDISF